MSLRWRTALGLSLLLAAGMGFYYFGIFLPHSLAITTAHGAGGGYSFGNDFYPVWLTSRECLPHRRDPYSPQITREIQSGLFGRALNSENPGDPPSDYRTFSYPAFVDVFGLFVAWLPFPMARIVLAVLLPFLTAASVVLWSKALNWKASAPALGIFVLLTLFSYTGLEALFAEQAGLIVGFLLAAAMAALVRNKLWQAGCLLAFATVKPQMAALLILYLLTWALANWRERWKFAASFLAILLGLILSAMLVWPQWIVSWLHVLLGYRHYSHPPLLGDLFSFYPGVFLLALVLAGSMAFAWRKRHLPPTSSQFGLIIGLLLAVTAIAVLPEHAVYDHIILLPGIMVVLRSWNRNWARSTAFRWTLALAAGAVLWPGFAALMVLVAWVVAPHSAAAILFLPLRTAAAVPFAVLALLFLIARQTMWKGDEETETSSSLGTSG
jgi:Glycosyltransferase family 87